MPHYLITISIGPVQNFIAAARKTRDLWMGSYLLSEISKAVAKTLYDNRGVLIFPNPKKPDSQLEPCTKVEGCFNVGNKILALIETDNPAGVVKLAEEEAQSRWEEIAKKAKTKVPVIEDLWQQQFDNRDVLEFFAAWVIFEPSNQEASYYKLRRERLEQLLNARKNTRDFLQNPITAHGIPKSSLDGLRENVIDHSGFKRWELRKSGLNKGEFLDITGMVKRLGEKPDQFTPLSRLAIDPWLRGMPDNIDLEAINLILKQLLDFGLCTPVKGNQSIYEALPYDGQLLFLPRIEAEKNKINLFKKKEKSDTDNSVIQLLDELAAHVRGLNKQYGEPQSYMVILAADGDRMGELLDNMQTLKEHQNISLTLTEFAKDVPDIVRNFRGHCIYAGGDDVLALLPLDQAIACSKKLADCFEKTMLKVEGLKQLKDQGKIEAPTLSVGLGISHFMSPMPKQLDLARKAEKLAKSNELPDARRKNALAVIVQPRSGAEISFRERWDKGAYTDLCKWIKAHLEGQIPRQAGYNLRDAAINLNWSNDGSEKSKKLINAETQRILERKRKRNNDGTESKVAPDWIDIVCERAKNIGLDKIADELIMTYRISQAYQLAGTEVCKKSDKEYVQEESHV